MSAPVHHADARLLTQALRDPATVAQLGVADWTGLITIARAEALMGTLAEQVRDQPMPAEVAALLADHREGAAAAQRAALWEAEMCRRSLSPLGIRTILLKGTAYAAANLAAARGRQIGDLDILVPRARLQDAEQALITAGWEWVKSDPYDDNYYRQWMHELPPLIHRDRDRMIDVHHTILPLTARTRPDAEAMIADAVPAGQDTTLYLLSPTDRVCHAVAHFMADGDFQGGLRNLWDIHCLLQEGAADPGWWRQLEGRAAHHGLLHELHLTARLAARLYGTPVPENWPEAGIFIRLVERRLLARNGWGQERCKILRLLFYLRSHLLRMPPMMLARHLWTKWRMSRSAA